MKTANKPQGESEERLAILRDILITQLGIAGVPQKNIQQIVGCSINRVSLIVKHIRSAKRKEQPGT